MKTLIKRISVLGLFILTANVLSAQWQTVGSGSSTGINNSPTTSSVNIGTSSTNTAYKFRVYTAGATQKGMRIHNTFGSLNGTGHWLNHALTISNNGYFGTNNSAFVDFTGNASFAGRMRIGQIDPASSPSLPIYSTAAGPINSNFRLMVEGLTYSTDLSSISLKIGSTSAWQYSGSEKLYVAGTSRFTTTSTFDGSVNMNGTVNMNSSVNMIGAVSIGNVSTSCFPTYKLFVGGGIMAEKVKVAVPGGSFWCDYVFEEDYELMPINELKNYLNKYKHLPHVQSEAEVIEDGVDLLETNRDLLRSVEELTLYIIQLQEQIDELKTAIK